MINIKNIRSKKQERLHNLFLSIGLALSLAAVVGAFEWRFYDTGSIIDLSYTAGDFEELKEIPLTDQPPPPPPPQQSVFVVFREVIDEEIIEEIEINLDVEITEDMIVTSEVIPVDLSELEEVAEEIFTIVEQQPAPVGGFGAFYTYIANNLEYPVSASRNSIEGKVFVKFVVEKDGSITDVVVLKGIEANCDNEAVKVIEAAPNWNPGKQRGRPVRVQMIIPIVFKLMG
ncbi:MAG: energy transducer TonB [Bacteroidetes bacterium]|nr:energy transducer TonB [Bacteroidota bacterium]